MFEIGDIIKISEFLAKKVSEIRNGFEADDSFKLADRYYQKGIIDLALVNIDKAIEKNKNSNDALFRLHILKGDLLIEKGMQLYQSKVKYPIVFERSIEEFAEAIKLDPFDPIAWLGKGFNHAMVGLIYANDEKNETTGRYHFYQTISSADAGLGSIEDKGPNKDVEQNLWALKGGAYYLIGNDEEGDKCFEKAGMPKNES